MTAYGLAVGTLLVEQGLKRVRQGRGGKRREQDVIAGATDGRITGSRIEPPAEGEGAQHVFVGPPRHGFGNVFGRSSPCSSDAVGYRNVSPGGPDHYQCHSSSPLSTGFEPAVPRSGQTVRVLAKFFCLAADSLELGGDRVIVCHRIRGRKLLQRLMDVL